MSEPTTRLGLDDGNLEVIDPPRKLRPTEQGILNRLLSESFIGNERLRQQAEMARVRAQARDDTRTIYFEVPNPVLAEVATRVPVEGQAEDDDGALVELLLHVRDGVLSQLEIYRPDGEPIQATEVRLRSVMTNMP